jgi:GNAT superfamily N-acetyltransferase
MAEYDSGDGRWFVRPTTLPTLNFHQFDPHLNFSRADKYSNYGSYQHHLYMDAGKGNIMGGIGWHKDTGEILGVSTEEPYRRLGVAATLFHEAKKAAREQGLVEPVHSADRSDMGQKWAKAVGGNLPKRMKLSDFPQL